MKIKQISKTLSPVLEQAQKDNDKYCFVYFSRKDDAYAGEYDLDSGDALIVVEELVRYAGIDVETLIEMLRNMDKPTKPFVLEPQVALLLACGKN